MWTHVITCGIWKYIRKKVWLCVVTHVVLEPIWHTGPRFSLHDCHTLKCGSKWEKMCQVDTCGKPGKSVANKASERNRTIKFTLLHTTLLHTSPHFAYFTPVCLLLHVSKRDFRFSTHCPMSKLWKCWSMHGTLEKCVNCSLMTHIVTQKITEIPRLSTPHHSFAQFDTVFHLWYWNFCQFWNYGFLII